MGKAFVCVKFNRLKPGVLSRRYVSSAYLQQKNIHTQRL